MLLSTSVSKDTIGTIHMLFSTLAFSDMMLTLPGEYHSILETVNFICLKGLQKSLHFTSKIWRMPFIIGIFLFFVCSPSDSSVMVAAVTIYSSKTQHFFISHRKMAMRWVCVSVCVFLCSVKTLLSDTVRQCEDAFKQQIKDAIHAERAVLADAVQKQARIDFAALFSRDYYILCRN